MEHSTLSRRRRRRCSGGSSSAGAHVPLLALAVLALAARSAAQTPGSMPDTPATNKLVVTPAFGQCFTNGTTTFRSNMEVKWTLVPFDGDAPYYIVDQTATELTVEAGHRGGRLLVVAQATNCALGTACAEQVTSPACAGVATGEITLAQEGAGICSQAFANASWTIVPWWKVVGVTVMLTSMGVLFALVVVARLKLGSVQQSASYNSAMMAPAAAFGASPAAAFGAPPPLQGSSRLTMSFGGPSAPLFTPVTRPDAASFA